LGTPAKEDVRLSTERTGEKLRGILGKEGQDGGRRLLKKFFIYYSVKKGI